MTSDHDRMAHMTTDAKKRALEAAQDDGGTRVQTDPENPTEARFCGAEGYCCPLCRREERL